MRRYQAVLHWESLEFVVQADDEVFATIEHWVNRIEQTPGISGDYGELDATGRKLQVAVLETVAITYWTDHAAQEVRVIRIEPL
jgi:hypothetical protein